ncbi:MAG: hypothetical protein P4L82_21245 [Ancalomicrobiaceae bacterium]|nr:hypothetical protein [Ancalomicrobiaceae bacterium]
MTVAASSPPAGFHRVKWAAGDPHRERARWSRLARAYAHQMHRPAVVALVAAIEPHLNSKLGYAWVSNEKLREEMGTPNLSSVERAVRIAFQLGVIDREIHRTHDQKGHVTSERRLWAAEHDAMHVEPPSSRSRKPRTRRLNAPPTPEFDGNMLKSTNELTQVVGETPSPELRRTLNRPVNGSGVNQDVGASDKENGESQLWKGGPTLTVGPVAARLIEAFAYVGPDCSRDEKGEFSDLLDIGRRTWLATRRGSIAASDALTVLEHAMDAARRSWTDHDSKVAAMLQHLEIAARLAVNDTGQRHRRFQSGQ